MTVLVAMAQLDRNGAVDGMVVPIALAPGSSWLVMVADLSGFCGSRVRPVFRSASRALVVDLGAVAARQR